MPPAASMPHYTELSRRAPATTSREVRAELDAHTHAAWRSRDGRTFRIYAIPVPPESTAYVVRQLEEDERSTEPLPKSALIAEYVEGRALFRVPSAGLGSQGPVLTQLLADILPS